MILLISSRKCTSVLLLECMTFGEATFQVDVKEWGEGGGTDLNVQLTFNKQGGK